MRSCGVGHFQRLFSGSRQEIEGLAKGVLNGDRKAISKKSSLPDDELQVDQLFKSLHKHYHISKADPIPTTIRLGFTGAPGVGKSTLIETFGLHLVEEQRKRLAILTVDPSSVRSGGSILGDKTRMPILSQHHHAYIRTSPNQGDSGGVIISTFDTIRLCEYAKFNVVLVETVGVGQSELAVANLVDILVLIVAPGIGDELQGLKKGITEIADMILVNKADDPHDKAANQTIFEYRSAMKFALGERIPKKVLPISGKTGRGVKEAWEAMLNFSESQGEHLLDKRKKQELNWMASVAQQHLTHRFQEFLNSAAQLMMVNNMSLKTSAKSILEEYQRHIAAK